MSHDYEIEVTIYDENIPPFWIKKIQKLKAALLENYWHVGTIEEKENMIRFHEREVLKQSIHIYWYSHQTIRIITGHDIDRDNLKLMERILGRIADIDITSKTGKIQLSFDCSKRYDDPYKKFKVFKNKDDIPRMLDGHKVEIYGWKWNDEINA